MGNSEWKGKERIQYSISVPGLGANLSMSF